MNEYYILNKNCCVLYEIFIPPFTLFLILKVCVCFYLHDSKTVSCYLTNAFLSDSMCFFKLLTLGSFMKLNNFKCKFKNKTKF